MPTRRPASVAILVVFVLSGAAGLIDEIVWSRQLVLVFGNTTQAVTTILVGFFGGMAIGAGLGGLIADRVRSPLRLYGLLEFALAAVVVSTPLTFRLINEVYRDVYPVLQSSPQQLALIRLGLALVAMAPATILMGATLPALTRYLSRNGALSQAFGRLYAANTVGAIAGTLTAGFVLIELLGLSGALAVGAGLSLYAGSIAFLLARTDDRTSSNRVMDEPGGGTPGDPPIGGHTGTALVVAFASGLTSLGYQILWTRLLASGSGNSTYVFTIILALFLTGLALGALLFNLLRTRLREPIRFLAAGQALTAAFVLLGLVWFVGRPPVLDASQPLAALAIVIVTAVPVVLLTTVVLGLTFPAASLLLPGSSTGAGSKAGLLVAANTVGAILGSLVVAMILIPIVGSPRSVALLAMINLLLAGYLSLRLDVPRSGSDRLTRAVIGAVAVAVVVAITSPTILAQPTASLVRASGGTVFAATEDEIATVVAGKIGDTPELWVAGTSMTLLTVDANLMTLLPLMTRPDSSDALVVAFGMGSSFRIALIAGLRTDAVELAPSVPHMFGYFHRDAAAVLASSNARVVIADGRNHLELTERTYDIIVTDPPPPIESSGASVISSLEYYEVGRSRLNAGGVMMQWLPFGSTLEEYRAHVRTFAAVFREVRILFGPGGYGTYMLGSDREIDLEASAIRSVLERPGVLDDLSSAFDSPTTSVDSWVSEIRAMTWLDNDQARAFVGDGPVVTDDRPLPEYFLLRRWLGQDQDVVTEVTLRSRTP